MRISTKGRYALRIMIDLAQQQKDKFISIQEISLRQDISVKYLEAIIGILTRAGFLISSRGKNGGYKLNKEPKDYTTGSILKLTEGSLYPVACLETQTNVCPRSDCCQTFEFWKGLNKVINNYVEGITIEDLLSKSEKGNDYTI